MLVVDQSGVFRRKLAGQAARFAVVGVLAGIVDLVIYHLALGTGLWVHAARALSFVVATVLAYVLNRRWSFDVAGSRRRTTAFAALYITTFFAVLTLHALALAVLPMTWWTTTAAWALSQAIGSTCNFIMLRLVIFRD
ncbi:GtrA family protein [Georgenia sp. 10Sc9-8]|uniref:GtrA family protein n=1 Tax=Georgenia halotolerans TaxID=3028317 RepID=A0ABT5TXU7_9MICO|nr:GtrA family protein [Georgenia halotolerans]